MKKSLAVFDIDGTLRQIFDPWMMLHHYFNTEEEGGKIYSNWREGKITYQEMCDQDAALWKGKSKEEMIKPLVNNPVRKGAKEVIQFYKDRGYVCVGISTGLSFLNDITAEELGLDKVYSNEIVFEDNVCTGKCIIHVEEFHKDKILDKVVKEFSITGDIVAFGDGEADVELFKNAAQSVAVFPRKPFIKEAADFCIEEEPIDQILAFL
ncbi:HAD family hydrolase [Flammeovirga agarivorans]|uniref:phosphoserine phosphatase n=1 Tax=Flammeovirga agarivorans TaxID=2726742 RepID=A0A7X8SNM6_9BACT|nr:HAD family phosphatase [Flammeovirga agarivorans]NLR93561.1 HAD-IB family phosphatase [Flammeovirga agarivorans]